MDTSKLFILLTCLLGLGLCKKFPIEAPKHIAENPLSDDMIDFINAAGANWTAGRNFHPDTDLRYLKRLCGVLPDHKKYRLPERRHSLKRGLRIPEEFDARTEWPECPSLEEIRDQGNCGSCWACSSAAAMTDRYCIGSKGDHFRFSTQDLLSCCHNCGEGCDGGYTSMAWSHWLRKGLVSGGPYESHEGCYPYEISPGSATQSSGRRTRLVGNGTPKCHKSCEDDYDKTYEEDLHFGRKAYSVSSKPEQIQLDIMKNGPVVASFTVYQDFMLYKSGVYHHVTGYENGAHAIKILGWGVEDGIPYWLAANSWNYSWGDGGFFKILRGYDECGIEDYVTAGTPKV